MWRDISSEKRLVLKWIKRQGITKEFKETSTAGFPSQCAINRSTRVQLQKQWKNRIETRQKVRQRYTLPRVLISWTFSTYFQVGFGIEHVQYCACVGPLSNDVDVDGGGVATPRNNRFNEQKQSLCTSDLCLDTFLRLPLKNNNVKWPNLYNVYLNTVTVKATSLWGRL